MNTNPEAINVLCYGDSNTWGQKPDKSGRYAANVRWTGRLQRALGEAYRIIEEGLGSRTTDLEYGKKPGRNGKTYLQPCLESHNPLDIVVLMLGTNDLKIEFTRSAEDIATAVEGLVADIKQYAIDRERKTPHIIVVSPILVDDKAPKFAEYYDGVYYDAESATKSQALAEAIKIVADENECAFVDASQSASAGEDGIHFNPEAHEGLARSIEEAIRKL
jgi:lysophospholipase L1-like esterase